jgi:putative ABC transport system permease protein
MSLDVRPILSALLRNWTGPALVASQIAITLAVLVNALYIVEQRIARIGQRSGTDIDNIFVIRSVGISDKYAHEASIRADLAYLRSVPGVVAATAMNYFPLGGDGDRFGAMLKPDDQTHAVGSFYFEVDEGGLPALGLKLVAGRNFQSNEVLPPRTADGTWAPVHQVIVTRDLAHDLYPDGQALGKTYYNTAGVLAQPATIIGIVEHLQGAVVGWKWINNVTLAPRLPFPDEPVANYVVRTAPGQRDAVLRSVEPRMRSSNADRMIEWARPLVFFKNRSYVTDRNMEVFLIAVMIMLVAITCIGIYGLATFNVTRRVKQIGTRRALGAQKADIIRYFLVENWLVTTVGIVIGCVLALAAGNWLSTNYGLPRLDLYYIVGGIPVLWVVGLLAAWLPAWRGAGISPATATRTV